MKRFLLDLELLSIGTLVEGESTLHAASKNGDVDVSVSVIRLNADEGTADLSMQVILDADSLKDASTRGLGIAQDLIRAWSFATSISVQFSALKRVADWTPGLEEREVAYFSKHSADGGPHAFLHSDTLESALRITGATLSSTLRRALRWFANGVSSEFTDDQFYYFWLAIELVAAETKEPAPVPDACPKCRGALFCPTCHITPHHKPYPKQAIQALFRRHVTNEPDRFFSMADKFRNALMHGDDLAALEQTQGTKLAFIVDCLGQLAQACLFDTIKAKMFAAGETGELPMLQTNRFTGYQVSVKSILIVSTKDANNPHVSELPVMDVTMHSPDEKPKSGQDKL
nr:methylamine utilization protein MauJ [uncultured Rhodoferax sp.]